MLTDCVITVVECNLGDLKVRGGVYSINLVHNYCINECKPILTVERFIRWRGKKLQAVSVLFDRDAVARMLLLSQSQANSARDCGLRVKAVLVLRLGISRSSQSVGVTR